jgi:hypothetical protein
MKQYSSSVLLTALAIVLGLALIVDQRAPVKPVAAAQASQPAPYVSSDPSVPSASSVKLPDAEPHIEAF